ncbi:hypothetical protein B296_00032279 [Ensete ventricosum]|uniref:Uncharacterized protein n=1 Tax=Ensete ventricosum TaxID=4639 RepID=A0A426XTL1_ENSVE|nr:hypothetical protein B296_00032279 [Ensete ventricosum]
MKFSNLCRSNLSQYLEFASAFSTSLAPFHDHTLSLNESKGSMTPRMSHLYCTMAVSSSWPYYSSPCIYVHFFAIGRFASAALRHSSESTFILTRYELWSIVILQLLRSYLYMIVPPIGAAHEERGSEQDEREVGYSPRVDEAPSGVPTGKKSHKERLTTAETCLDVLEASLEELYQG